MGQSKLMSRVKAGKLTRQDVARRLGELAFGRANDCVRLALEENVSPEQLDLSLLTEIKRNDKGTVEIRLVDRLRALEMLSQMAQSTGEDLESFLAALKGGEED